MAQIKQLDPQLANMIAAGEVVERPASVVKELMENAVDAGATAVTVEIQSGGMSLIRVQDNGRGIPPQEVELAFLRHATSKLSLPRDLEAIESLGFRGEALAAIAAVSRVELLTRTEGATFGTVLLLDGGVLREKEESGCPEGTTMVVRDLFFNTPARLKFMKRDATEGAAVYALVQKLALAHPGVSVQFIRDGKRELYTPGDGMAASVLHSVFGRDLALGFTPVKSHGEEVRVEGFVSLPACCRGTRGYQHFIMNGRPIRAPLLMAALEEAYRNQKMVGKFPACVLYIGVRPNSVDVNVHPAKTEVKFLSERKVFDAVHYGVLSALEGEARHPTMTLERRIIIPKAVPEPEEAPANKLGFKEMINSHELKDVKRHQFPSPFEVLLQEEGAHPAKATPKAVTPRVPVAKASAQVPPKTPSEATPPSLAQKKPAPKATVEEMEHSSLAPLGKETKQVSVVPQKEEDASSIEESCLDVAPAYRMVGELMHTYIMVEQGDAVHMIDKHAAHERLLFDRMQAEDYRPMSQSLMEARVLNLPLEEVEVLTGELAVLEQLGFALEEFGGGALLLRAIPADLDLQTAEESLSEIAAAIGKGRRAGSAHGRDEILHTVACKAAIKGGASSAPEELMVLVEAVMEGRVKYCPHGRPVAITLRRSQLERQFGRA